MSFLVNLQTAEAREAICSLCVLRGLVSPLGIEWPSAKGYTGVAGRKWKQQELGALSHSACEREVWPPGQTELGSKE